MITVDVKQFVKDHSIFGFFCWYHTPLKLNSHRNVVTGPQVWRVGWRWNWHTDLEADWNCTVWHRCYKRHARTQFK